MTLLEQRGRAFRSGDSGNNESPEGTKERDEEGKRQLPEEAGAATLAGYHWMEGSRDQRPGLS